MKDEQRAGPFADAMREAVEAEAERNDPYTAIIREWQEAYSGHCPVCGNAVDCTDPEPFCNLCWREIKPTLWQRVKRWWFS